MSATKPVLPARSKGVHMTPNLPARPRIETPKLGPTLPPKVVSSKPILPSRTSLHLNAPKLPVRSDIRSQRSIIETCGRIKPAKYEEKDFAIVDEYVRGLPAYRTTEELAHALVCNFEDSVDQLRAIFCWIAFNIAYDIVSFKNNAVPPQSARSTFENRLAVCSGYSQIFQELCDLSGLKCIEINGMCRGVGFDASNVQVKESTHAWNAVFVNQEWRMIDSTWGAGHIDTAFHFKFNNFYFLTDPDEFVYDHMPLDERSLFTTKHVSWEQYVAFNSLKSTFWQNQVKLLNHIDQAGCLKAQHGEEIVIRLMIPAGSAITSTIPPGMGHTMCTRTKCPVAGFIEVDVKYRMARMGSLEISIFLKSALVGAQDTYSQLIAFHVDVCPGVNFEQYSDLGYPTIYNHETMEHCSLISPLVSPLPLRTTQEFVLEDLSDDTLANPLDLYLWIDGKPGPQMRRSTQVDRVLYTARCHVATVNSISIAQKNGNHYGFLAQWKT